MGLAMSTPAILTSFSFSARTAEVTSKLMHDVETNPGPNCSGVSNFKIIIFVFDIRVTALALGSWVTNLEFSTTTGQIHLSGFFLVQLTLLAAINATLPPLQQQSRRSQTGSILMSVARG